MSVSVFYVADIGGIVFPQSGTPPFPRFFSCSTFVPYLTINEKRVSREKPKPVKARKKEEGIRAVGAHKNKGMATLTRSHAGGIINQFTSTWHRR